MDSVDRLLKTIRGVSKTNPVTNLQLSEIIRRLWSDQGKIIQIIYNEIINNTTNVYQAITEVVNEEVTNNTTNIYQSISQIIRTEKDANHESFLIENTANISETVLSSWSVIPYNQQVGEFKAVVMVRNKVTNTIVTLMSLFSFDYSDATTAVIQNDLLTDAGMTLTLGVNGSNQLYATVSGMPADAKRIHFCYERCALAERVWLIAGEMEFNLGMAAELMSIVDMGALPNDFSLTMAATLSAYANASAEMCFGLGMSAAVVNAENPAFTFTIGAIADTAITLPLPSGGYIYNCTVDWGDGVIGTITSYNDADATHTYLTTGDRQIKITGICQGFSVINGAFKTYIKSINNWGNCDFLKLNFYGCSNLTTLPAGSITGANNIYNFLDTFRSCTSLTSIPPNLFNNNTLLSASGFQQTFYGCSSLTSIPSALFANNTLVSTQGFLGTFNGCSSLTSIPSGLFNNNTLLSTGGFNGTFSNCSLLTSIPSGLFDNNTLVSTQGFYNTFSYCTSLTSIPAGLFDKNTSVSSSGFFYTFLFCTSLTSIPVGLFDKNTAVSTSGFYGTFRQCTSLTAIPTNLFLYNVNCTNFNGCFYNCNKVDGNVPELWVQYSSLIGTAIAQCFSNCVLADNYAAIPAAWK